MKSSKLMTFAAVALSLSLVGCGQLVEVPPAYKGKVLSQAGFQPESIQPSKFRLPFCVAYCDRLVLVEASDVGEIEEFDLFMPKDQLSMPFNMRFTYSIRTDDATINGLVSSVPAEPIAGTDATQVPAKEVYRRYGAPIMRSVVLATLPEYDINTIASSRQLVNQKLTTAIQNAFENTPIQIKTVALDNIQFPKIITDQKIVAAQRRIDVEREEANKQVRLVQIQTELESAKKNRAVRRENAEAAREENEILAASTSERYLEYRRLEVLEQLAKSGASTFVPYEALDTLGVSNRIFGAPVKSAIKPPVEVVPAQ